jgi:hypothetical protein
VLSLHEFAHKFCRLFLKIKDDKEALFLNKKRKARSRTYFAGYLDRSRLPTTTMDTPAGACGDARKILRTSTR